MSGPVSTKTTEPSGMVIGPSGNMRPLEMIPVSDSCISTASVCYDFLEVSASA